MPTAEEKLALYDTMLAYAGIYELKNGAVIHSIEMGWNGAWEGTQQIRYFQFEGDRLLYRGAPAINPLNGCGCVHKVVFERAGAAT